MRGEVRRRLARLLAAARAILAVLRRRRGVGQADEHEGATEAYAAQLHDLNKVADDLVDLDGDARALHDWFDAWEAKWAPQFAAMAARVGEVADRLAEDAGVELGDVPAARSLDWALEVTCGPVEVPTAADFAEVMEIATGERELVHA